ncbi:MAG TPA: Hsp20/alpha crystallin family protein [Thermoanaerobaculia bacterium]|nr:Hsp20/alpha crystallin family protein [Thermoanaerobaculia bacterium]
MIETEQTSPTATEIDRTIDRMEQFYRSVTGREAPPADTGYAPIPAEKDPAEYVEKQLGRLLQMLGATPAQAAEPAWRPPMSVKESDRQILIRIDLPGVSRDQVRVTTQGNVMTVSGVRPQSDDGELRLLWRERPSGPFRRAVWIPGGLGPSEPSAEMKAGVLEIRITREASEAAGPKAIRVS